MEPVWVAIPGLLIWCSILLLPWRPWSTRESLEADSTLDGDLSSVTVLIPARNEQESIHKTLISVAAQGQQHKIILIDDQSSDETAAIARGLEIKNLQVINGEPLPEGWTGKLWALEQGRKQATTPYILLLDADIEIKPGTLPALLKKLHEDELHLVSLMAYLRMESFWEKLLMPAFIYFFKLLYPFHLSNSRSKLVAAAAGGCILIETEILNRIGGFSALKHALIDDCTLARCVKQHNGKTWLGLTHSAISRRPYENLETIWEMVARTAFTQLHYSIGLLLLCTLLMAVAYVLPILALFLTGGSSFLIALTTLVIMAITYHPVLKYYGLHPGWVVTLPITGCLYLLMTWSSAARHWQGVKATWKNRTYTH